MKNLNNMAQLTQSTKTISEKDIKRDWKLFDAKDKVLGRLATEIASVLIGKNRTDYSPSQDMGDYAVVINAKDVKMTGKKDEVKVYTKYSGYPGGLKTIKFKDMLHNKPEVIIERAVSGMLAKNKLRKRKITRLYVFRSDNIPENIKSKLSNKV